MTTRLVFTDCRWYRGSVPCAPHKREGTLCGESCLHYGRIEHTVCVVKLGAMGDVLRTTAILPDLLRDHPRAHVTWVTAPESVDMLVDHPSIARVVAAHNTFELSGLHFDVCYALDSDFDGLAAARVIIARERRGFVSNQVGLCVGVAPGGDATLFNLGLWDDLKLANETPYLDLLAAAAGVSYTREHRPFVSVPNCERVHARDVLGRLPRPLIGLNADAGTRWARKHWNFEYLETVARWALQEGWGVAIFGDGSVAVRNAALAERLGEGAVAYESSGNVRRFFAGIAQCDILLTGDTLAMHAAWGLGVRVVALFGPTSLAEISLDPRDVKLADTALPCLGCYLPTCTVDPHCMDRLSPDTVFQALRSVLGREQILTEA